MRLKVKRQKAKWLMPGGCSWRFASWSCLLGLAILAVPSSLLAIGECGAQFLKIGVGARACAMGEAFGALTDDATAIYWNPAGLGQLSKIEFVGMQNFWLLDMSYQYLAVAFPLGQGYGTIGAAGAYSSSGKIPKYEDFQKVGDYTAYDACGTITYANKVGGFHFGAGVKLIQQKIENEDATGFGGDVGLLYIIEFAGKSRENRQRMSPYPERSTYYQREIPRNPWEGQQMSGPYQQKRAYYEKEVSNNCVNIGLTVQHIGPGIKFIEKADPLPLNVKMGIAGKFGPAVLTVDVNKPIDNNFRVNIGGEFTIMKVLSFRAGFNTANSYTLGLGIAIQMVAIDYAFIPYREIDAAHRISARLRF